MNKQRYLAELQRLLVFMTPGDRERTVRRFSNMFDAAGPEGEAALIEELGSPTKAAISLSRGYEPDSVPEPAEPEIPAEPEEAPAQEKDENDPWEEIPDFEPPALEGIIEAEDEDVSPTAEPVPAPDPAPAPAPAKAAPTLADLRAEFSAPEEPEAGEEPSEPEVPEMPEEPARPRVARTMPLGLGIPLFLLVFAALGIPLAALLIAVTVVLLVPGCAILYAAWLIFVGGLWCTNFMADAILLFGACAIVLALGLMILFLGLWLAVTLIRLYGKGFGWVAGELLGRRVSDDA